MFERIKRFVFRTVKDDAGNEVQRLERYEAELSAGDPDLPKMPPATPVHNGDIARRIGEAAAGVSTVNIDDEWRPSSAGWPSGHDWDRDRHRFCSPHPSGGIVYVRISEHGMTTARHVPTVAGEPKIVDEIISWGAAFVWP